MELVYGILGCYALLALLFAALLAWTLAARMLGPALSAKVAALLTNGGLGLLLVAYVVLLIWIAGFFRGSLFLAVQFGIPAYIYWHEAQRKRAFHSPHRAKPRIAPHRMSSVASGS